MFDSTDPTVAEKPAAAANGSALKKPKLMKDDDGDTDNTADDPNALSNFTISKVRINSYHIVWSGRFLVLVATNVAARGLDINDVQLIIQGELEELGFTDIKKRSLLSSMENYVTLLVQTGKIIYSPS
ncbi:hypothetical protein B296_00038512 [Ensete ventricosum]|uniref:Uncharacterized protein n=1 Tax=Ensete ventricosum TaxID=4639 RepID=A0A426ZTS5_ENSVE|nr:hypothetical protein B296_00038512 [Ensete ventricosum]